MTLNKFFDNNFNLYCNFYILIKVKLLFVCFKLINIKIDYFRLVFIYI